MNRIEELVQKDKLYKIILSSRSLYHFLQHNPQSTIYELAANLEVPVQLTRPILSQLISQQEIISYWKFDLQSNLNFEYFSLK